MSLPLLLRQKADAKPDPVTGHGEIRVRRVETSHVRGIILHTRLFDDGDHNSDWRRPSYPATSLAALRAGSY